MSSTYDRKRLYIGRINLFPKKNQANPFTVLIGLRNPSSFGFVVVKSQFPLIASNANLLLRGIRL